MDILYRDDALLAVHKPAGLLVHRSMLDRHETRFALQMARDLVGRHVHAVHRLDKGTSGVLLFAFEREVAAALGQAFEQRAVGKCYTAIVRGHPADSGRIDHPLRRHEDEAGRHLPDGPLQDAVTHWRTLERFELPVRVDRYPSSRYALLELAPETGRRHQLRRHMKHLSHPIIGDATWGKGAHNRMIAARFGSARMLLACTRLAFDHPVTGRPMRVECAPAPDFMQVLDGLREQGALSAPGESRHNDDPIHCRQNDS